MRATVAAPAGGALSTSFTLRPEMTLDASHVILPRLLNSESLVMNYAEIHPNWDREPEYITEGFSVEITAKDVEGLRDAAPNLPPDTPVAVTFLPGETLQARLTAASEVRALGFEPMPHFSARRIKSEAEFHTMVERMVEEAGVRRCFAIAGDPPKAEGPYSETAMLIETGVFEANGIKAIGVAGHPQGHPNMTEDECFAVIERKCRMILERGMKPLIVTQFGFDPDAFMQWLVELRKRGIDAPVRIGVPGPTSIKALLKFAARCGVEASASVMSKYGISLASLIGTAGPDKMVNAFASGFGGEHGRVRLHFYPFGGLVRTAEWIANYNRRHHNLKS
jgi:methylenetetrahydrofolate reductase (NADPH)